MRFDASFITRHGALHSHNEDAICICGEVIDSNMEELRTISGAVEQFPMALAVADGLGSHPSGEMASRFVAESLCARLEKEWFEATLDEIASRVNADLFALSQSLGQRKRMGCCAAGVIFTSDECTIFNVGDVRVYLVDNELILLSRDDRSEGSSTRLTSSFGGVADCEILTPHSRCLKAFGGMRILICSDGVHDVLEPKILSKVMRQQGRLAVAEIAKLCSDAGMPDDISVVDIEVGRDKDTT